HRVPREFPPSGPSRNRAATPEQRARPLSAQFRSNRPSSRYPQPPLRRAIQHPRTPYVLSQRKCQASLLHSSTELPPTRPPSLFPRSPRIGSSAESPARPSSSPPTHLNRTDKFPAVNNPIEFSGDRVAICFFRIRQYHGASQGF